MVFGIITAIAACPAIIGTTEAVREGQKAEARETHRGRRCYLVCSLPNLCLESRIFDGARVVLRDGKCYIGVMKDEKAQGVKEKEDHPFTGFYYAYPANQSRWKAAGFKGEGLVTTVPPATPSSPPALNWMYVDKTTHEVKYGIRALAEKNWTGPWDCTDVERRLTFEGWEGFVAVKEGNEWGLYFDRDDDGLRDKQGSGKRVLRVLLTRKEIAKTKEKADEERWENVKEMRSKGEKVE